MNWKMVRGRLAAAGARAGLYGRTMLWWLLLAAVTGGLCGLLGTAFHRGVEYAASLRAAHPWLLWCLPLAGLAIVAIYRLTGTEGVGTNDVLEEVHHGRGLPLPLLPAIFCGTVLTHLCGGSAGREGAALQMGGTIGYHTGRLLHLDDRDLRTATMTGMAAFFSALFGTPLAAAVFAGMVVSVGAFYHADLVPSLLAALIAYGVSRLLGVAPTRFSAAVPALAAGTMVRVAVLGVLCGLVAMVFCGGIHLAEHRLQRWIPNAWLRAAAGGLAVAVLTTLLGTTDYNGAGMDVITAAVENGQAAPAAAWWKLVFTALTLGAGFKGGEVVPSFFVGATFGCVVGPLLGLPAGFAAAVGLAAVFCGAVNCPLASTFLAVELFGAGGLWYFALACCLSYVFSGYSGLYSSQTILYSKLKARYLNVQTNHHRAEPLPEEETPKP